MAINWKYDKLLAKIREKDVGITFTGNAGDVFDDTGADGQKGFTSSKILSKLQDLVKKFGSNGRLRYDSALKHWFFEVLDNGAWVNKFEIGGSAFVDVLYFLKSQKPTDVRDGSVGLFGKENIVNGQSIIRPRFSDSDLNEYGFVVYDGSHGFIVYRKDDGTLEHIPTAFTDSKGTEYRDINTIEFSDDFTISKTGNNLKVNINGISNFTDIELDSNLLITSFNYNNYNYKNILANNDEDVLQSIKLPKISELSNDFTVRITNDRPNNDIVQVSCDASDTISGRFSIRLYKNDVLTVRKPSIDNRWLIDRFRRSDILDENIDGGGA